MIDDLDDLLDAAATPHSPEMAKPATAHAAATAGEGPVSRWRGTARTAVEAWAGLQRALKNRTGTPAPWRSPVEGMQTNAAASEAERMAFGSLGVQVTAVAAFTQLAQAEARAEDLPGRALHVPRGEATTGDGMRVSSVGAPATPEDGYAAKAYAIGTTIIPTAYLLPIGIGGVPLAQGGPPALVLAPSGGRLTLPDSPVLPGLMTEMPTAARFARPSSEPEPQRAAEARPAAARAPAEAEVAAPIARIHSPAEKPSPGSPSRSEEEGRQAAKPRDDAEQPQAPSESSAPLPSLRADEEPSGRLDTAWQEAQPSKLPGLSASLDRGPVAPDPSHLLGPVRLDDGSLLGRKNGLDQGGSSASGKDDSNGSGAGGAARRQQDDDATPQLLAQGAEKVPATGTPDKGSGPMEGAKDSVETADPTTAAAGPLANGQGRDSETVTDAATPGDRPHPLSNLVQAVAGLVPKPGKDDATGGGQQAPSSGPGRGTETGTAVPAGARESDSRGNGNADPHGRSDPRDPQRADATTDQDTAEAPQPPGPGSQSADHRPAPDLADRKGVEVPPTAGLADKLADLPDSRPNSPATAEASQPPAGLVGQLAGLPDPRPVSPATSEAPRPPGLVGQLASLPDPRPDSPATTEAPQPPAGLVGQLAGLLDPRPDNPATSEAPRPPGLVDQLAGLLDPRPDNPATAEAPRPPGLVGQLAGLLDPRPDNPATSEAPRPPGLVDQLAGLLDPRPDNPATAEAPRPPGLVGQLAGLLDPRPVSPATAEAPTAPEPKSHSADHPPASHPDITEAPQSRGPSQGAGIPAAPPAPTPQQVAETTTAPTPEEPARTSPAGPPVPVDGLPGVPAAAAPDAAGGNGGKAGNGHRAAGLADRQDAQGGPDAPRDLRLDEGAQPGPAIAAQTEEKPHPSHADGQGGAMAAGDDVALAQDVLDQLPALLARLDRVDHDVVPEVMLPAALTESPIPAALPVDLVLPLSGMPGEPGDLVLL